MKQGLKWHQVLRTRGVPSKESEASRDTELSPWGGPLSTVARAGGEAALGEEDVHSVVAPSTLKLKLQWGWRPGSGEGQIKVR